jgi:hypothetical protein
MLKLVPISLGFLILVTSIAYAQKNDENVSLTRGDVLYGWTSNAGSKLQLRVSGCDKPHSWLLLTQEVATEIKGGEKAWMPSGVVIPMGPGSMRPLYLKDGSEEGELVMVTLLKIDFDACVGTFEFSTVSGTK